MSVFRRIGSDSDVLQWIQGAIVQEFDRLESKFPRPWGLATPVKFDDYDAKWDELIRCDTEVDGSFTVFLPKAEHIRVGNRLTIKKVSDDQTGIITVTSRSDDTIDGAASAALSGDGRPSMTLVCVSNTEWLKMNENSVLSVGNSSTWNYFDTTAPAGVNAAPLLVYQFDGSSNHLVNRVTAGTHDLTVENGASRVNRTDGFVGAFFQRDNNYIAPASAALRITGSMTLEVIFCPSEIRAAGQGICHCRGPIASEVLADNILYGMLLDAADISLIYNSESGAGVNSDVLYGNDHAIVGQIMMAAFSRTAGTNVAYYKNGVSRTPAGTAVTTPTGGTSARFRIGDNDGTLAQPYHGTIFSLRLWSGQTFTEAQCLESYQRVRGFI